MTNVPWPEEELQRCRIMWLDGKSAREIAMELGKSRNAIIGRMRRMRLDLRDESLLRKPVAPRTAPRAKPKPKKPKPGNLWIPPKPMDESVCDIWGLTNKTCRWPIGEATGAKQLFCGLPEADLANCRPYCDAHTYGSYRDLP